MDPQVKTSTHEQVPLWMYRMIRMIVNNTVTLSRMKVSYLIILKSMKLQRTLTTGKLSGRWGRSWVVTIYLFLKRISFNRTRATIPGRVNCLKVLPMFQSQCHQMTKTGEVKHNPPGLRTRVVWRKISSSRCQNLNSVGIRYTLLIPILLIGLASQFLVGEIQKLNWICNFPASLKLLHIHQLVQFHAQLLKSISEDGRKMLRRAVTLWIRPLDLTGVPVKYKNVWLKA